MIDQAQGVLGIFSLNQEIPPAAEAQESKRAVSQPRSPVLESNAAEPSSCTTRPEASSTGLGWFLQADHQRSLLFPS